MFSQVSKWFVRYGLVLSAVVGVGLVVLGSSLYFDDFSNKKSGWATGTIPRIADWSYTDDGQYRVLTTNKGVIAISGAPVDEVPAEFCLEADVRQLTNSGLAQDGQVGLFVGFQRQGRDASFAYVGILPSGLADIGTYSGGSINHLLGIPWPLEKFNAPPTANRVRIVVQGGKLTASVNGEELPQVSAPGRGQVGVLAIPDSQPNVNGRFDNFRLMTPDCKS